MNIGIIVDNDFDRDIRVTREARLLAKQGYNIFVLCFGFFKTNYTGKGNVHIIRINIPVKLKNILFLLYNTLPFYKWLWQYHIKKLLRKRQIDFIHVHDLHMILPAYRAIRKSGKPARLIADLHENFPAAIMEYKWANGSFSSLIVKPGLWKKNERKILEKADHIIVISSKYKNQLQSIYKLPEQKISVYPNTIDIDHFDSYKTDYGIIKDFYKTKPVVFYFGVIAERRGIFDLIESTRRIITRGDDFSLLLIGPVDKADRDKFFAEISDPPLAKNIIYIPWISIRLLPTYLGLSDICVAPLKVNEQHNSGVANKIFQYMYGGKPIIASACKPMEELILEHDCGLIYNNNDELAGHISALLHNPEKAGRLGQNGRNALFKFYNNELIDKKLIKVYENL